MIDALEKYARADKGYHGVTFNLNGNDRMESFFLAETLKYLYLLYSNDSILPCIVLLT
jgi:mannosyl-oligosaccharide alpha-1,2-mannosidase